MTERQLNAAMQLAENYARAYHKWHGEDIAQGDHQRMVDARSALYDGLAKPEAQPEAAPAPQAAEMARPLTDEEISRAVNASWRYEDKPFPVCRAAEAMFLSVNAGKTIPATGEQATGGLE